MANPIAAVKLTSSGRVECYDARGTYLKTITVSASSCIGAHCSGGTITLSRKDGRTEFYNATTGNYMMQR